MTAEPEPHSPDLPALYRSPWRRLAEDLADARADLRLRGLELLRRNREGSLPVPSWWPVALIQAFWPLLLGGLLVVGVVALLRLSAGPARPRAEPPTGALPAPADLRSPSSPMAGAAPSSGVARTEAPEAGPPPAAQGESQAEPRIPPLSALPPEPAVPPEGVSAGQPAPLAQPHPEPRPAPESVAAPKQRSRPWARDPGRASRPGAPLAAPSAAAPIPAAPPASSPGPAAQPAPAEPPPAAAETAGPSSLERDLADADPDGLIRDRRSDDATATLTLELDDRFAAQGGSDRLRLALAWQVRAAELGYERLELRDRQGHLLGRPARVGAGMVLLQPAA